MSSETGQLSYPIEQAAIDLIHGAELLINHYGEWPALIDAEVIRLTLERTPTDLTATSNLRAVFFTFDIHRSPGDPLRKQAHTEILFGGISSVSMKDWAHQNPIQGWSITRHWHDLLQRECFHVFWGGIGHETRFDCERITVVDVMDLNPFQKSLSSLAP